VTDSVVEGNALNIFWLSNAPFSNSGYGTQTKLVTPELQKLGHNVRLMTNYGLETGTLVYNGMEVYSRALDVWGMDILPAHMGHTKSNVLVTLQDLWTISNLGLMAVENGWTWIPWLPIDFDPIPDKVLRNLDGVHTALPFSRFGERLLTQAGVRNRYIPHVLNPAFYPEDKRKAKEKMGIPQEKFLIGMVAMNNADPSRKAIPEQLMAFSRFHEKYPNTMMYLHTFVGRQYRGINVVDVVNSLGLNDSVMWSEQYAYTLGFSDDDMRVLYNAFDLLSCASRFEGFGLPILEAQACGTPVVTTDATSMSELTWSGIAVGNTRKTWHPLSRWIDVPDPNEIFNAYCQMYETMQTEDGRNEFRNNAIEGAKFFEKDRVIQEYWKPLLDDIVVERMAERVRRIRYEVPDE